MRWYEGWNISISRVQLPETTTLVSRASQASQSGNILKSLFPSYTRKGAVAELIAMGKGTTKGICEEQNGQPQNEALNRKAWVKRIDQTGAVLR
jgi:hypothetical protein